MIEIFAMCACIYITHVCTDKYMCTYKCVSPESENENKWKGYLTLLMDVT